MFRIRKISLVAALSCAGSALFPGTAQAAGFLFYEVGTPEVGLASAGFAARAASPSTLLTNPAGMSRLEGSQVEVGSVLVYGHLQFAPDSQTDPILGRNDGGNAVGFLPSGGVFATFGPWRDVRFGLGVFTNFGAPESWDPPWLGRYYTTKTTLLGFSVMPGVAWHITDGLSVGGTVNAMYGVLKQVVAVQNLEAQATDGSLEVSSRTWGIGGNVGILYSLSPETRVGLTYTSPVKLNFASMPGFSGLGPGLSAAIAARGLDTATIDLGMTVPQTVTFGFFQALGDRWAVMGDVGWQNWAAFGAVEIGVPSSNLGSLTTQIAFTDTWHVALGAQVQLSKAWLLSFGIAYDSSMTDAETRSLSLPLASQLRLGIGAQVAIDEHWNLGLASELLWDGSPSIDVDRGPLTGRVSGSYASTWILYFAFGFTWRA
jgi:long-chain fatty acid transport protein